MNTIFNSPNSHKIICGILLLLIFFFTTKLIIYTHKKGRETAHQTIPSLEPIKRHIEENRRVYASKNGKRYYPWWCEAGSRIAKQNIIWYETAAGARAAGYTIAKACQ